MQIFLDSADLQEIEKINGLGVIDGITTNPALLAKSSSNCGATVKRICEIVQGDVSVEVSASDFAGMVRQGEKLLTIAKNVVIKLPITWDGLKACKYFAAKGVKVNMTLCFSVTQALLAAKAGAFYVSPFVGRLDDIGQDGMSLIADIKEVYDQYSHIFQTKILVASVRNVQHVYQALLIGADCATMSGKIIEQLVEHPLTSQGLADFEKAWNNAKLTI